MKIFALEYPLSATDSGHTPFRVWPDSCWILSRRPVFVPGFAPRFIGVPAIAVKISRLGKCVEPRFAPRYYAEWTAAIINLPAMPDSTPREALWESGYIPVFDNTLVIGNWVPLDPNPLPASLRLTLSGSTQRETEIPSLPAAAFDGAIHLLSAHNTLKMGDMILFPLSEGAFILDEGLHARITSGDAPELISTPYK